MKNMKKFLVLLLAAVLCLSMTTVAMAADGTNDNSGTITINNAVPGQTYTIYQLLVLESYNTEAEAYAYKAAPAWETWLKTQTSYVTFDSQGYVQWVENADAAAFAKAALAEAKRTGSGITSQGQEIAPAAAKGADHSTVTFNNLNLGYYLVDSSLGALCSLDTTDNSVTITEKNDEPTIDKQVKEDSNDQYGDSNTAQIGDTVEFQITINAKKGAQNYVLHDKMTDGLTLNQNSFEVKVGETSLTATTDYSITFNKDDECDFEIAFTKSYLDSITENTAIVVTYTAILNQNAVISGSTNDNEAKLDYGDSSSTTWDKTTTTTFSFDIVKTDSDKKVLDGAKFELYDAENAGNKIPLVKNTDGTYRVATTAEAEAEGFTSAVIDAGRATVNGLDANTTYWLEETEAPDGYNKLAGRVEVKIENANLSTTMEGDTWAEGNGGVQITNNKGSELPSTGGIGTTIFYVIGGILVVGAGVLLITKKRMSHNG